MSKQQLEAILAMGAQYPMPAIDDVPAFRAFADHAWGQLPAADGVDYDTVDLNGLAAEWVRPQAGDTGRVILYLHGGGFYICSPRSHRAITSRLAQMSGAAVLAPDYRLAPEHPAPAAHHDALHAYRYLLAQGYAPAQISIAGDSAGGNLALSLPLAAREAGLPQPAALLLLSPLVDMRDETPSHREVDDPVLPFEMLTLAKHLYFGAGGQPSHSFVATLDSDFRGLPPTLVHVGGWERLRDDATWLVARLKAAGVNAQVKVYDGMVHVWQIYAALLEEAEASLAEGAAFLAEHSR